MNFRRHLSMTIMKYDEPRRVLIALSGGVDSTMAAWLLTKEKWDVLGVHFLLSGGRKANAGKIEAVRAAARYLDVPLKIVDIRPSFERLVLQPFVDAYSKGFTPNPCVVCNEAVKFEYLFRMASQQGIPRIATGHYARVDREKGTTGIRLFRGHDPNKDQSYFLHRVGQAYLERVLFPLGEKTKSWVRDQAGRLGIPSHSAPESQEICFLSGNDYRQFIETRRGREAGKKGPIVDKTGKVLGEHHGAHRYTIGQRKGLGIASSSPYYVKELRPSANEVLVGRKQDLFSREVVAENVVWIEDRPCHGSELQAQIRYRHKASPGILHIPSPDKVRFVFHEPQWAVTPGQALVCYEGDRVLGGGWICKGNGKDF